VTAPENRLVEMGVTLPDVPVPVAKLLGMANTESGFAHHPKVVNGAFGLAGEAEHAHSAGVGSLPDRIDVEMEAMFHVR
jgi:hypothetical protein